jgi:hypothetical protein
MRALAPRVSGDRKPSDIQPRGSRFEQWGRYQTVDRSFLPNFIFGPADIAVALGQDGLVANIMKYLDGHR